MQPAPTRPFQKSPPRRVYMIQGSGALPPTDRRVVSKPRASAGRRKVGTSCRPRVVESYRIIIVGEPHILESSPASIPTSRPPIRPSSTHTVTELLIARGSLVLR